MASINPAEQFAFLRTSKLAAYLGGVLLAVVGLVVLFWPRGTIKVVAILVGIGLVITGVAHIVEALGSRDLGYWGILLARGILDLIIGLVVVFWPEITVWVLVLLFGIELLVAGVISVYLSFQVPKDSGLKTGYLVRAAISILAGLVVLAWPTATVWVLVVLVGLYFLFFGVLLLWIGYQLGKAEHDVAAA